MMDPILWLLGLALLVAAVGPTWLSATERRERLRLRPTHEALCRMPGCPLPLGHNGSHVSAWPGL